MKEEQYRSIISKFNFLNFFRVKRVPNLQILITPLNSPYTEEIILSDITIICLMTSASTNLAKKLFTSVKMN